MNKLSEKIISTLKSNTYNSVYANTLAKLPIVVTRDGAYAEIDGDTYPIFDNNESYLDGVNLVDVTTSQTEYTAEELAYLRIINTLSLWKKCRINNVKKFHYDDTWYSYRLSVDYPEETFGILEVSNLPFRPLDKLMNKKSFICRMDQLIFNDIMEPFLVFINRKFVNWNAIDVVFDCDDTYLLLHGDEYNHFNLVTADVMLLILPFKAEFIGEESDYIWNTNYNMLHNYLQDSLHMNEIDKIEIDVPNINTIYKHRGMVYNVGAWMHTQLYMRHIGLLSDDRINKLKRMILTKITYDNAGNIISTYNTKFNAFDKDNYDFKLYNNIKNRNIDYIRNRAIFKFDNNGILSNDGANIISNLDESMRTKFYQGNDPDILLNYSDFDETLFRESFVTFKSGLFYPECIMNRYGLNIFNIENPEENDYVIVTFNPSYIEMVTKLSDSFINQEYFINKILDNKESNDEDTSTLITKANECLNYSYLDNLLYKNNFDNGFNTVIDFNPLLLNDLTTSNIKTTVIYGNRANELLLAPLGTESRKGLKIPRCRYKDHETYVIVFLNGELIENYSEMYAASNYFFLPVNDEFADGDVIELLYFTYCNNNELHFTITDNMISKLEDSEDPTFVISELFTEYINSEDIKIFAKYPKDIMIYPGVVKENDDIAFNISYRQTKNNDLYVFKNIVTDKSSKLTAVSSRKFIYERLYIDQKAYRIKLDKRFRYCDNQKQYILFINGRRMEDDAFFITVPKYSRPFNGIYLYTRKFVNPEDRIEIFYVPEELCNINTDYELAALNTDGYIETNKESIDVPYYNDFYLYFINGKKIPYSDIVSIDTHTIRLKSDTKTLNKLNINAIYNSTDDGIVSYMNDTEKLSKHDSMIKYIKNTFGYSELDNLFDTRIKISDVEEDYLKCNVDHIAIINEIVRDFWVTSGYEYNERPFVYDYALDEFIIKDGDNYILPALDATPELNIIKNYIRLLYLKYNKGPIFEIGSTVNDLQFDWEFSAPIENATMTLVSQYVNDIQLDTDIRSYIHPEPITEDTSFYFKFNTMHDLIDKKIDIKFYNGIYYGSVDEDLLQHYTNQRSYLSLDKLIAVVAKDKSIPSVAEQKLENESISVIKKDNYVIYNLKLAEFNNTDRFIF